MSNESVQSGFFDSQQAQTNKEVKKRWWGNKRLGERNTFSLMMVERKWTSFILDYAVYCPEGIANFPSNSLPHLFHARCVAFFETI